MNISKVLKKNHIIKENILITELDCGIKCYIIPKKKYKLKQCAIVVSYGSNDLSFYINDKKSDIYVSEKGTAHFIEHKLFSKPDYDIFSIFTKQGADVNAFTDFSKTVYYFNCINNFYENVETLIYMIKNPYFTNENVESEKKIISQEINMYDDNPDWRVYYEMLNLMYKNHNIKYQIAGTNNTIQKIDDNMLYKCYNSFYIPKNMNIVCVGDFDVNNLYNFINRKFLNFNNDVNVKSLYDYDDNKINDNFCCISMDIKETVFNIGYKLDSYFFESDIKKKLAIKIVTDIFFGEGSVFYNELYNIELLKESLGMEFLSGKGFAFFVLSGKSNYYYEISKKITKTLEDAKKIGISYNDFERIKNKHKSRFIRGFNSIEAITMAQVDFANQNIDIFDVYDLFDEITLEYLKEILDKGFFEENKVISVVKPK